MFSLCHYRHRAQKLVGEGVSSLRNEISALSIEEDTFITGLLFKADCPNAGPNKFQSAVRWRYQIARLLRILFANCESKRLLSKITV